MSSYKFHKEPTGENTEKPEEPKTDHKFPVEGYPADWVDEEEAKLN
jgi:hypothetical protein